MTQQALRELVNFLSSINEDDYVDVEVLREKADEYKSALKALLGEQREAQGDYVLVPREPTDEMRKAAIEYYRQQHPNPVFIPIGELNGIYDVMMAAALQESEEK